MTLPIFLVLALLVTVVICFSLEKISVDIITLLLLCALVLLRLLPIREAFAGFSSDIVIVLAALFVLSGALIKTGVMDNFGSAIARIAGTSRTRVLLVLMPATACIAAFLHNTTTTAVFLPAVLGLCRKSRLSPSQVLIPFAFASMMGGTCTLLASSTTIAASGYMASAGLRPIGLFEFLPFGLAVIGTGILYMVAIGARFLPRREEGSLTDSYQVREYLSEVVVTGPSPLAGRTLRELRLSAMGLTVLAIHRGDQTLYPGPGVSLEAGDLLIVKARREALLEVKQTEGMEIVPDLHLGDQDLVGGTVKIAEAIVMPQSLLIGRTLRELNFRQRYGLTVIAVHRRGHAFPTKIGTLSLRVGDVLLLQGDAERFADLGNSLDVWVLEQTEHYAGARRSRQRLLAVGLFAVAVGAAGIGVLPLAIAFLLAALAAILLGLISAEEAYKSIHWRLIILIAGMTSFGAAMKSSGAAAYLANLIVHWGAPLGVPWILLGFAVLTMLLSQPMSNAAAALVVLPVALSTAAALHVQPRTFGIVVTLAASISYITPFEPSCLLVYGPGKYRFRDFLIAGAPLSLLLLGVLMLLAPLLWPLW